MLITGFGGVFYHIDNHMFKKIVFGNGFWYLQICYYPIKI